MTLIASRDVPAGDSWAFRNHRTLAEVERDASYRNGRLVQPIKRPKPRKYAQRRRQAA